MKKLLFTLLYFCGLFLFDGSVRAVSRSDVEVMDKALRLAELKRKDSEQAEQALRCVRSEQAKQVLRCLRSGQVFVEIAHSITQALRRIEHKRSEEKQSRQCFKDWLDGKLSSKDLLKSDHKLRIKECFLADAALDFMRKERPAVWVAYEASVDGSSKKEDLLYKVLSSHESFFTVVSTALNSTSMPF